MQPGEDQRITRKTRERARRRKTQGAFQGKQFENNLRPCFVNIVCIMVLFHRRSPKSFSFCLDYRSVWRECVKMCLRVLCMCGERGALAQKLICAEVQSPHPSLNSRTAPDSIRPHRRQLNFICLNALVIKVRLTRTHSI